MSRDNAIGNYLCSFCGQWVPGGASHQCNEYICGYGYGLPSNEQIINLLRQILEALKEIKDAIK